MEDERRSTAQLQGAAGGGGAIEEEKLYLDEPGIALDPGNFPSERYKPLALLRSSPGSSVYLARDTLLNKRVAIKTLRNLGPRELISFQDEAKATSMLKHRNIVGVLDFGTTSGGAPYMVLEFVDGPSLEDLLSKEGPLEWAIGKQLFLEICQALEYAHERGILHRDIKPGNILLTPSSEGRFNVCIIDFGLAKLHVAQTASDQEPTMSGTPLYFSPDPGLGRPYDVRSEIYSLGCVLYECLSGQPPFQGQTALQTLAMHATSPPPKLPEHLSFLQQFLEKTLAKEPSERYQSIAEFRQALLEIEAPEPVLVSTGYIDGARHLPARRRITSGTISFLCIAASIAGLYWVLNGRQQSTPPGPGSINARLARSAGGQSQQKAGTGSSSSAQPVPKKALKNPVDLGVDLSDDEANTFDSLANKYISNEKWEFRSDGTVRGHHVSDVDFIDLKNRKNIKDMTLTLESSATGKGFASILNQPLQRVDTSSGEFNDEGAACLSQFKDLYRISFAFCPKLTIKGIKKVVLLPKLTQFKLRELKHLPPGSLAAIAESKSINSLDLAHSRPITADDLDRLQSLKLKNLDLSDTGINDDCVPALLKLSVESLEIGGTEISEKGFMKLGKNASLQVVVIDPKNQITPDRKRLFELTYPHCRVVEKGEFQYQAKEFNKIMKQENLHFTQ